MLTVRWHVGRGALPDGFSPRQRCAHAVRTFLEAVMSGRFRFNNESLALRAPL